MSLALIADVGAKEGNRVVALVGSSMAGALLLAAIEGFLDGAAGSGWLPLGCSLACAGLCLRACLRRRPAVRLQVMPDGMLRLHSATRDGEVRDAVFVRGWSLGRTIFLQLRPVSGVDPAALGGNRPQSVSAFGSGDCRLLLESRSFDGAQWHALRRWLVWHRRSHRPTRVSKP
jgi:hypothetical protein